MSESIRATLSTAKSAIQLAGLIQESYKTWDDIQFKLKMTELSNMITEVKDAIGGLREENVDLREKMLALEKRLALADELEFDGTKFWKRKEDGQKEGPYCQKCRDKDGKMVRLTKESNEMGVYWNCVVCKESYDYKSPPMRRPDYPSSSWV